MKMIYVDCGLRDKYESDIRRNENYLSSSEKKRREKKFRPVRGLYRACTGILTQDHCDTGAALYQLR